MKAIIPIAGLGTRLLPFSKVIPKAMLPVHDRPCVQWIVEELNEAGVNDVIFVYSKGQEMVREYFSEKTWYDFELQERGHLQHVENLENIRALAHFGFVEQKEQLGDGHAILQARELIGDEPFLVIFGDCLYQGDDVIEKLKRRYEKTKNTIVAVQGIDPAFTSQYGIVSTDDDGKILSMIEKPPQLRTSNSELPLALIGRYLLTPTIWPHLEKNHSTSGEIRLIDALKELQKDEEIYAVEMTGTWLDTGTLEGMQRATEVLKNQ